MSDGSFQLRTKKALATTGCRASLIPPISAVGLKCVCAARSKPRAHHAQSPPSHAAPLPSGNDAWLAPAGAALVSLLADGQDSRRPNFTATQGARLPFFSILNS